MPEWLHIAVRSFAAITLLFTITRILGKKQISQLTFFEYITGIAIGELAGFMSTNLEAHFVHGLTALFIWFSVPLTLEFLTLKNDRLRELFEGKGTVLVQDGRILEDNLRKERYTADELLGQLRTKSVFKVADVEFAVLEASGEISVLLKKEHQPVSGMDLGLVQEAEKQTQTVIMDGRIMDEPLSNSGLTREWLHSQLESRGITVENVFLGQVDSKGHFYADLYNDEMHMPDIDRESFLMATLKKCEADLVLYSLSTKDAQAQQLYAESSSELQELIDRIKPLLNK